MLHFTVICEGIWSWRKTYAIMFMYLHLNLYCYLMC